MNGALIVDKPEGWTSHDVVNKIRRIAGTRRVGHLGTLDPIATGVLPLLIGQATRLAQFHNQARKTYEAVLRFGFATDTYDRAGVPVPPETQPVLDREELEAALAPMRGKILQTPPPVSAKKVGGVPAYKLARRKIEIELEPVEVEIYELTVLVVSGSLATIRVCCSAGTYVRAIAHEAGRTLGCGAHVHALRRTASGDFTIDRARTIPLLEETGAAQALIPLSELLPEMPAVMVDSLTEGQIRNGRDFHASPFRARSEARMVRALSESGELVAIGEAKLPNVYHPVVVFEPEPRESFA